MGFSPGRIATSHFYPHPGRGRGSDTNTSSSAPMVGRPERKRQRNRHSGKTKVTDLPSCRAEAQESPTTGNSGTPAKGHGVVLENSTKNDLDTGQFAERE